MANLFIITPQKTLHKAKIDRNIAKIHKGFNSKNASTKAKFFDQVIANLERNFTGDNKAMFEKIKCCVIGSPGFVRENFLKHMQAEAIRRNSDFLKTILGRVVLAPCSSGFKHSLNELMGNQAVKERISAMSCSGETASLDEFFRLAEMDQYKVTYGPKSVTLALD